MREHHKRHLSKFCKCGKEMYMDSKGWHCPDDKRELKPKCRKLSVPKDCCYIQFSKGKIAHSRDLMTSNRMECMTFDFDKYNRVIGIELIGDKPCQNEKE